MRVRSFIWAVVWLAGCGVEERADFAPLGPSEWAAPAAEGAAPPPSPAGALSLTHDLLLVGQPATFHASDAAAGETVYFMWSPGGFGAGPCPAPLGGLCMDITGSVKLLGSAVADGNGDAAFTLALPASAPVGGAMYVQAAVVRGIGGADSVKSHPVQGRLVDPAAAPACDGAVSISGDSAYLMCSNATVWADGADSCDQHGGSLVTIDSQAEDDTVLGAAAVAGGGDWYIGYSDQLAEGFFEWWDGSPTVYLNWAPGEPNDFAGTEDCAEVRVSTGDWNDISCDTDQPYICELDVTNTGATCDGEIRYHDGHPYAFCANALDWLSANSTCSALGMTLATLDDEDENRFVGEQAASIASGDWWIGLDDSTVEGRWDWVEGTPTFFTNWETSQPDNASNEDCVEIRPGSYEWNDRACTVANAFICEG